MQDRVGRNQRNQTCRPVEIKALRTRYPLQREAAFQQGGRAARNIAEARDQQAFHLGHFSDMHNVTLQPSGLQFQVEDGESVLTAALRQGYVLPYGCKNGACGSCKGKIVSGSVDYGMYQPRAL